MKAEILELQIEIHKLKERLDKLEKKKFDPRPFLSYVDRNNIMLSPKYLLRS